MNGKPLQIVKINGNNIEVDEDILKNILLKPEIKDRYVCVYSIAGAFRKGKSFLLNFFLRFLYTKYGHKDIGDFLEDEDIALTGFSWRNGVEPDTLGILMWSDVFLHDFDNGDKVAIILLDTQGAFDHQSTVRDCTSIFALSTMLSSVQIYNISQQIQENDLQHLELFMEYGKMALEQNNIKPFQKLLFLIRDWCWLDEYEYGDKGGLYYMKEVFKSGKNKDGNLRERINKCFKMINCFLMPHPGLNVRKNDFNGSLKDIESDFLYNLRKLETLLFLPENLLIKEVNGSKICAGDWVQYIQSYVQIFKKNKLPQPQTIFMATSEVSNQRLVVESRTMYNNFMAPQCCVEKRCLSEKMLQNYHTEFKNKAISYFDVNPKMGSFELMQKYRDELESDIEQDLEKFKLINIGNYNEIEIGLADKVNELTKQYCHKLDENFGDDKPYVNKEDLEKFHLTVSKEIMQSLTSETSKNLRKHRSQLELNLNVAYSNIVKLNEGKLCRIEGLALQLVQSIKNAYLNQMETTCKNFIKNINEKHIETKQQVLLQYGDLLNDLNDQLIGNHREQLEVFFDDSFQRFLTENQMKFEHLETTIVNEALFARVMFTESLRSQCKYLSNLTTDELNSTITTIRNSVLEAFDLNCQHINEEIWNDCHEKLDFDLLMISNSAISNIIQLKIGSEDENVRRWLGLAEFIGTLALGGTGNLIKIGTAILMAAKAYKLASGMDNVPN